MDAVFATRRLGTDAVFATLVFGVAVNASAIGATLSGSSTITPGAAAGQSQGVAPGATLAGSSNITPGAASGGGTGGNGTAPGATLNGVGTLTPGAPTGDRGATAPGATLDGVSTLTPGLGSDGSLADGFQLLASDVSLATTFIDVSPAARSYLPGQAVRLGLRVADIEGLTADPGAVVLRIRPPAGPVISYSLADTAEIVRDGVGLYHADLQLLMAGLWSYRWELDAPLSGAAEGVVNVLRSRVI